jgi:hypothetical protein
MGKGFIELGSSLGRTHSVEFGKSFELFGGSVPELSLLLDIANEPNTSPDTLIKMLDSHLGHLELSDCCFDDALREEGKPASIYEVIALRKDINDEIFERLINISESDVAVQLDFMIHQVSNQFLTLTFLEQIVESYSELFPDEQLLQLFAGIYLHAKANKQFKKIVLDSLKEFEDEEIDADEWDSALAKWE